MRLHNLTPVNNHQPVNILVQNQKIQDAGRPDKANFTIDLTGAMAFPGLINSHDHLDFNCFTPLGDRIYNNYTEWGNHIHASYKDEIDRVLKIPLSLRAAWGIYKNLLAGVTTVVNHGDSLKINNPLIDIYQRPQNLHSVRFQKKWKWKLNNPFVSNRSCVIHAGEGSDQASSNEIDELIRWNFLRRKIIVVHGVAMNPLQAKQFAGLVWCPESNRVLLNRHADIYQLKEHIQVVLGTDSTLTGSWNIWKHLRLARQLRLADDPSLFDMVTTSAAQLWRLNKGSLDPGRDADIVVATAKNKSLSWDSFFSINPTDLLMVLHKGHIRLFDKSLLPQLENHIDLGRFTEINAGATIKLVEGDLPALIKAIKQYHPGVQLPPEVSITSDAIHD
jgi:cytosine/adenosine deaminase-related metal-dependent hydrolase